MAFLFSRCAIPGLDNDTFAVQNDLHLSLINSTIPLADDSEHLYDQCHWYKHTEGGHVTKETCHKWVYDTSVFETTLAAEVSTVITTIVSILISE